MGWDSKSRPNKNAFRLLRQKAESDFEYREYGVERIRPKATYEQLHDLIWYDLPHRSSFRHHSWKKHRKTHYK